MKCEVADTRTYVVMVVCQGIRAEQVYPRYRRKEIYTWQKIAYVFA